MNNPVLKQITQSARRPGAITGDPPCTIAGTRDIETDQMQPMTSGHRKVVINAKESRVVPQQLRRQNAFTNQPLGSKQISQDGFQNTGPLSQPGGQPIPILLRDGNRHGRQLPRTSLRAFTGVDLKRRSVLTNQLFDLRFAVVQP